MTLSNITIPLEEHCLLVNCDIEVNFDVDEKTHPDNPIQVQTATYRIENINHVEFLLLDKVGVTVPKIKWQILEKSLEQLVLNEIEWKNIEEIKAM